MFSTTSSDQVKKICEVVEDRDNKIFEMDVKIKYYQNALEKVKNEIKQYEKEKNRLREENKLVQQQLDQLEIIKKCVKEGNEVAWGCLKNHEKLDELLDKEIESREKESLKLIDKNQHIYNEAKLKLRENPMYRKMEEAKAEFLKWDIEKRDLERKIQIKKKICREKKEIKQRIYYNFFVELAENYLIQQGLKEIEKLKMEEAQALRKLREAEERVRLKKKIGTGGDGLKKMTNISFGMQECQQQVKQRNKPETPQTQTEPQPTPQQTKPIKPNTKLINQNLKALLESKEPAQLPPEPAPKVRILNEQVVVQAVPAFVAPERRKTNTMRFSKQWEQLMRTGTKIKESGRNASQLSLGSQRSQLSQQTPVQVETLNIESENAVADNTINIDTQYSSPYTQSQTNSEKSHFQPTESPNESGVMVENVRTALAPVSKLKQRAGSLGMSSKMPFDEHPKSVRFNLDTSQEAKEPKGLFGATSMFGSFFGKSPLDASQTSQALLEVSGEGLDPMRSPDYSYELMEGEVGQGAFKQPEITPFGRGGGLFNLGAQSMFKPF